MEIFGYTIQFSLDVILFILFIVALGLLIFLNRKSITIQKIAFPVFYIIMHRTSIGLGLMEKIATKYRSIVQFVGYICIGLGFVGMLYVSISILVFFFQLIFKPAMETTGVSLVLPFTNIPGIGYLSFTHWILSIFILAIVHEFAHGVVARAHNIPVKSSGFAVFAIFAPLIPAAFVEPDEKKLQKAPDVVQYSVFAAGPLANLALAFLIALAFPFVADMTNSTLAPFEDKITSPVGFSYEILEEEGYPAYTAAVPSGILTGINGKDIENYAEFYGYASCLVPGQDVSLETQAGTYTFTTIENPDNPEKGFMGIKPTQNERRINPEYENIAGIYYWLRGFLKWLFLLNLFIGLANLLPLGIVDGGRMLQTALHSLFEDKTKAQKIWTIISLLFLFGLIFAVIVNYLGNPFAALFG